MRPPGAPGWEQTAAAWLLDLCPADWRGYPGLRRHLVVLARFAVIHVEAGQAAASRGLSEARADLREVADLDVVEAAVQTWQLEQAAAPRRTTLGRAGRGRHPRAAVHRPALTAHPIPRLDE